MAPWLRFLEAWAVQQLLRTPAFHRAVEKVARGVHRARHGIPPEELGGTKLDQPNQTGFIKHFVDELKVQLGAAEQQQAAGAQKNSRVIDNSIDARRAGAAAQEATDGSADAVWRTAQKNSSTAEAGRTGATAQQRAADEGADAVWQTAQRNASQAPSQGFMGEYMNALREQVKSNKPGR